MGLYRYAPQPSGRMGLLWALGTIKDAVVLEFGSMGHMLYAERWIWQSGAFEGCKLYTTHLDEKDIALGITKRFHQAVEEIIKKENPNVIFILPSTVPLITGVDMEALCEEANYDFPGITFIVLKKGSFHEKLHHGIEEVLYRLAKEIPAKESMEGKTEAVTVNIIGSCLDLTKFQADVTELKRILKEALGINTLCILTSETSIEQIRDLGKAHLNLVLRREGIKAAKELKNSFQTEYYYGSPYGYTGTLTWLSHIAKILHLSLNEAFVEQEMTEGRYGLDYLKEVVALNPQKGSIILGGNLDVVLGMKEFAVGELGMLCKFAWCNAKDYGTEEIPYQTEEDLLTKLDKSFPGIIMADHAALKMTGRDERYLITRSLSSRTFNKYESPFMGFRGGMKLSSLWLAYLLKQE